MGVQAATEPNRLTTYLAERAKALVASLGIFLAAAIAAIIADPNTAAAIASVVPEQFRYIIPIVLAIAGFKAVEFTRNRVADPGEDDEQGDDEEPTDVR